MGTRDLALDIEIDRHVDRVESSGRIEWRFVVVEGWIDHVGCDSACGTVSEFRVPRSDPARCQPNHRGRGTRVRVCGDGILRTIPEWIPRPGAVESDLLAIGGGRILYPLVDHRKETLKKEKKNKEEKEQENVEPCVVHP